MMFFVLVDRKINKTNQETNNKAVPYLKSQERHLALENKLQLAELLMIYEINHIWTAEMKWTWRNHCRSERNLCNCIKKPEKNFPQVIYDLFHISLTLIFFSAVLT